ncbi:MAG TPA: hypothetical protein VF735_17750 [Pyrinomonadaceae bacterium]
MRGGKLRLIRILAIILVVGLALFSPLFSPSIDEAAKVDMNVPQQFARVAELDRPRTEVRIERVLNLDEFKGFDPDLASGLRNSRERRFSDDASAVEQLASLSTEHASDNVR